MFASRRQLLRSALSSVAILSFALKLFPAQRPLPQPIPSPNAPDPNFPQGMNGPGPNGPDQKTLDRQNAAQIRADVDKMYALISDLKKQLGLTDTMFVLSVDFVKKAHDIEKLAKQVKDLAKG